MDHSTIEAHRSVLYPSCRSSSRASPVERHTRHTNRSLPTLSVTNTITAIPQAYRTGRTPVLPSNLPVYALLPMYYIVNVCESVISGLARREVRLFAGLGYSCQK